MKTSIYILMLMLPMLATAQRMSDLAIAGQATTEVIPDITIVNLSLSTLDMDYAKAMEQLQTKADETKKFIKKNSICKEQIISEDFAINKQYVYENRKQVFKGYKATVNIKVEFKNDLKMANKLLNALGESSAEAETNVWHKISQALQDKVNDELIKEAIKDAQRKAGIIAESTDQQLHQITKINYGVQENISVAAPMEHARMMTDMAMKGTANQELSITPAPIKKTTDIIIYWKLIQK